MAKSLIKTYPVTGMSCASCALNVERMLKRQPGVLNASVNYADASAVVEMSTLATDVVSLQSAVRSIGYDLLIGEAEADRKVEAEQKHYKNEFDKIWEVINYHEHDQDGRVIR